MIIWIVLLAGVLGAGSALQAAEDELATLRVGADVYQKVRVTSLTATDIYFIHSRGLGNAKLKDLEPAMQQHFHFDPAKAAAKTAQQAQANALYAKALRETPPPKPQLATAPAPPQEAPNSANEVPSHAIHAKSFLNQPAPRLSIEKWLTGPPDINGKFVLVDFWATWCGPCRRSIPKLNELQARFRDRLVVIGLSDESEQAVRRMTQPRIEYAVGIDTQHRSSSTVEVRGIPHALLVDPKGIVRFEGLPQYLDEKNLETLITRYSE